MYSLSREPRVVPNLRHCHPPKSPEPPAIQPSRAQPSASRLGHTPPAGHLVTTPPPLPRPSMPQLIAPGAGSSIIAVITVKTTRLDCWHRPRPRPRPLSSNNSALLPLNNPQTSRRKALSFCFWIPQFFCLVSVFVAIRLPLSLSSL